MLLLPLLAAGIAAMPNSVTVATQTEILYCSFYGTLPDGSNPIGLPLCGMVIFALFGLVAIYVATKKKQLLNVASWVSLGAATLSVLPLLLRTEPMVIPNVGVAILLCVEAILTTLCYKQGEKAAAAPGKRLK